MAQSLPHARAMRKKHGAKLAGKPASCRQSHRPRKAPTWPSPSATPAQQAATLKLTLARAALVVKVLLTSATHSPAHCHSSLATAARAGWLLKGPPALLLPCAQEHLEEQGTQKR